MRYVKAMQLQLQTDELFEKGIDTGTYIGFEKLSEYYNVKRGCTTYIGGIPSHGKSEFLFEILMSLSLHYGWKHGIHTPETGSPIEVVAELAHKFIGRPFVKNEFQMSQQEKYKADAWLNDHFFIAKPDETKMSVENLLEIALEIKKNEGLDTFSIDPFNELTHDYSKTNGREDKYLEYVLGKIRRFAREHNIHIFIVAHPRTLRPENGIYLPPTAFELSGGAAWYAKAETILCVHRPDMASNSVEVHIQKSKPKYTGKKGTANLFWDFKTSRYYEKGEFGDKYSSRREIMQPRAEKGAIKPNLNFYETEKQDLPF